MAFSLKNFYTTISAVGCPLKLLNANAGLQLKAAQPQALPSNASLSFSALLDDRF